MALAALLLVMLVLNVPVLAATTATFNNPAFSATWQRVDLAVQNGMVGANRGYTWGPLVAAAQNVSQEAYNGGPRPVQYFDKARMEINNPGGNTNSLYFVTTGLLVREMVTGQRQDRDTQFTQLVPSPVRVAGDSNQGGANAIVPTYSSFASLGTFGGQSSPDLAGQLITTAVDKNGNLMA